MILHRANTLPACLAIARSKTDDQHLVVIIGGGLDRRQVRELSRVLLAEPERRQLLRAT
jgi:hypothetical protein